MRPKYRYTTIIAISLVFGFAFFLRHSSAFSQEKVFPLTVESLASSRMDVYYYPYTKWSIQFQTDASYSLHEQFEETEFEDSGHYTIKDGKAELIPSRCLLHGPSSDSAMDCDHSLGHALCFLVPTPQSLYATQALTCRSERNRHLIRWDETDDAISFPFPSTKIAPGTKRSFRGIPVITMGLRSGKTVGAAQIRVEPSVSAVVLQYPMNPMPAQTFIPDRTSVVLIARTMKKEIIEGHENYWFLISVGMAKEVWMFGEFVRLDG